MSAWRILSNKIAALAFGILLASALHAGESVLASSPASAIELHGAGATFPAPLYLAWIERFQKDHPAVTIRYEPVGSGEGLARFGSGVVDFAGSDVPVSAAGAGRFERIGAQFPSTAGMIVLAYNLPGITGALRLPRSVYTDIFLGKIRRWDDPRIAAANPEVQLPATNIAVIGRLDSSGTTFAFTSHLAAANPAWSENGPGVGKIVSWPNVAMLARGNEGVASRIKISEGAIGYVEYGFARRLGLPMAALENKDGKFIAPTPEAGVAAISGTAQFSIDSLATSVVDPTDPAAYPIVTYSWLMILRTYPEDQGRAMRAFLNFVLGEGQSMSSDIGYIPLPAAVADLGKAVVASTLAEEVGAAAPSSTDTKSSEATTAAPSATTKDLRETTRKPETAEASPAESAPQAPSSTRSETYTVARGDTFKSIAVKLYRDSARWRDIVAANPKLNPRRRLRAGQILKLPEPVEATGHSL
ncbi:MAG: phosphate ABC transporter substrate-binding protein PstS [Methylocystis sp.]